MLHWEDKQQNWHSVPEACSRGTFLECNFMSHVSWPHQEQQAESLKVATTRSLFRHCCAHSFVFQLSTNGCVDQRVSRSVHILGCLVSNVCFSSCALDGWRQSLVKAYGPEYTSEKAGDDEFQTGLPIDPRHRGSWRTRRAHLARGSIRARPSSWTAL